MPLFHAAADGMASRDEDDVVLEEDDLQEIVMDAENALEDTRLQFWGATPPRGCVS